MYVRETSAAEIAAHEGEVRALTGALAITASTMTALLAADVNARLGGGTVSQTNSQL
jgi:hypothetical protein